MSRRGSGESAFLVGDMPFISYQADVGEAMRNAGRFLQAGRMNAVKLEGRRDAAATRGGDGALPGALYGSLFERCET